MPEISKVSPEEADGIVADIYQQIQDQKEKLPDLFQVLGQKPEILKSTWKKMQQVMQTDEVDSQLKKLVAFRVSVINKADYCITNHKRELKKDYSESQLAAVKNGDYQQLNERETKILEFVDKAVEDYQKIDAEDFAELGLTEPEVLEIIEVIDLFSGLNRVTEILNLQP